MKIVLTEKERIHVNEFLDRIEKLCDAEDIKVLNDVRAKLDNPEFKESEVIEFFLRTNFILDETEDSAKSLNRAYNNMNGEWNSIKFKIFAKVSKVFLLHNTWTRNFYNATMYYIANFKQAIDKMVSKDFRVEDEPTMPDEVRPSSDGRCIGGNCHQCTEYEDCPTGQMSEY